MTGASLGGAPRPTAPQQVSYGSRYVGPASNVQAAKLGTGGPAVRPSAADVAGGQRESQLYDKMRQWAGVKQGIGRSFNARGIRGSLPLGATLEAGEGFGRSMIGDEISRRGSQQMSEQGEEQLRLREAMQDQERAMQQQVLQEQMMAQQQQASERQQLQAYASQQRQQNQELEEQARYAAAMSALGAAQYTPSGGGVEAGAVAPTTLASIREQQRQLREGGIHASEPIVRAGPSQSKYPTNMGYRSTSDGRLSVPVNSPADLARYVKSLEGPPPPNKPAAPDYGLKLRGAGWGL
jgi:hypothetical protein